MRKLAVITDPDWGWISIRVRWKRHFSPRLPTPTWFDLENYSGWESRTPLVRRLKWLRNALEGRRCAKDAIAKGHRQILVATLQYAPLFPLPKGVKYYIYGDATPRQYDELYCNEFDDRPRKRILRNRLKRVAEAGHHMLCMSPWYRDGLIERYGVRPEQATVLRPLIDTEMWKPPTARTEGPLKVLFIGGDFLRKGGDILLDMSAQDRFAGCEWHLVTGHDPLPGRNVHFYRGLGSDSEELRSLVALCDVLVLPTKADCYSHVAIEAGACGLPSVITDVGGISDIVETGANGVLLPQPDQPLVEEAVAGYLADRAKLRREGAEARRRVEERNSIGVHMGVLEGLIG